MYGTAQYKLDIYMSVTQEFLDQFLMPLVSFMQANIHLHASTLHECIRSCAHVQPVSGQTNLFIACMQHARSPTNLFRPCVQLVSDPINLLSNSRVIRVVRCMHGQGTSESGFN